MPPLPGGVPGTRVGCSVFNETCDFTSYSTQAVEFLLLFIHTRYRFEDPTLVGPLSSSFRVSFMSVA